MRGVSVLLICTVIVLTAAQRTTIKINEIATMSTQNSYTPPVYTPPAVQSPVVARQPAAVSLPALYDSLGAQDKADVLTAWSALNGHCYQTRTTEYIYELCPFRNVTQKGVVNTALHVVLGIWGSWAPAPHTPFDMVYNDGNQCASGKRRSIHVHFVCAAEGPDASAPRLSSVAEPATCEYTVQFHIALACPDAQPEGLTLPEPPADAAAASATTGATGTPARVPSDCRSQLADKKSTVEAMQACIDYLTGVGAAPKKGTRSPCAPFVASAPAATPAAKAKKAAPAAGKPAAAGKAAKPAPKAKHAAAAAAGRAAAAAAVEDDFASDTAADDGPDAGVDADDADDAGEDSAGAAAAADVDAASEDDVEEER